MATSPSLEISDLRVLQDSRAADWLKDIQQAHEKSTAYLAEENLAAARDEAIKGIRLCNRFKGWDFNSAQDPASKKARDLFFLLSEVLVTVDGN